MIVTEPAYIKSAMHYKYITYSHNKKALISLGCDVSKFIFIDVEQPE